MTTDQPRGDGSAAIAERLMALPKFGTGLGLHRTEHLLEGLPGHGWFEGLDALKITGSKGKGSVAALTEAILRSLGVRAGLFTSPHLLDPSERIRIAGEPIGERSLAEAADWTLARVAAYEAAHPGDRVGAFEALVTMALWHFARQQAEALVIEAGIGGRYDPTRLVPGGVVALTSVEREHERLLGETPELIAFDKSDLCPHGGTLLVGWLDPELVRRLRTYCRLRHVDLVDVREEVELGEPSYDQGLMHFELRVRGHDFGRISSALPGLHQARNLALATSLAWRWLERRDRLSLDALHDAVIDAAATVHWPGRMQRVARDPDVVIDVGHTPESAAAAAATIRALYPERRILLVTGVSRDKHVDEVLAALVPAADDVLCTRAHHMGSPVQAVAERCERLRAGAVWRRVEAVEEAVELARTRAAAKGMVVWIAGGLFLAAEALAHLRGRDPSTLRFF
ncbi:MAG: hypothetical protein KDK70_20610 [Myxococcales bacterium]|nr:hypothetical protein [Myxococcales bacterium]